MAPRYSRGLLLRLVPASRAQRHLLRGYLTSNALPPLSLLPNPAHRARHRSKPTLQQLSEVSLTSGPSGFTQLGCSPTPRQELNPDLDVGGACGLAHGAPRARRPACSVPDPHCSVGQGLAGGRWGPPWPQDPTSGAAASRCVVTSQLWAPSPPATPGPRSPKAARPRPLFAVQAEGCTWSGLKGGREQSPGLLEAFG